MARSFCNEIRNGVLSVLDGRFIEKATYEFLWCAENSLHKLTHA